MSLLWLLEVYLVLLIVVRYAWPRRIGKDGEYFKKFVYWIANWALNVKFCNETALGQEEFCPVTEIETLE